MRMLATLGLCALAGFSAPCAAAPLIFQYTGTVFSVTLLDGETDTLGLSVGSTVTGSAFIDTSAIDTDPSDSRAFYVDPVMRMRFDGIQSTPPRYDYSYFEVDADPSRDVVSAYLSQEYGNVFEVFSFILESPDSRAILGSDTPNWSALSLADFSDSGFEFVRATFSGPPSEYQEGPVARTLISARFDSLQIRPVPEPGTLALLGLGLAGLGFARRRKLN